MNEYNSAVTPLSIVDAAVPLLGHCHCVLGYLVSPTLVPIHYTDILEARTPPPRLSISQHSQASGTVSD